MQGSGGPKNFSVVFIFIFLEHSAGGTGVGSYELLCYASCLKNECVYNYCGIVCTYIYSSILACCIIQQLSPGKLNTSHQNSGHKL